MEEFCTTIEKINTLLERVNLKEYLRRELRKPFSDGMIARVFCTNCRKIKEVPKRGLEEILQLSSDQSVQEEHFKGAINWRKNIITINKCFCTNGGGRIALRSHCINLKRERLKIRVLNIS